MTVEDDPLGRTVRREPVSCAKSGADPCWVTDGVVAVRPPLEINRMATARDVATMRREFARWLAVDVAAGDQTDDLVLVVNEALANVADHAYADGCTGPVRLVAHRAHLIVQITVADDGRWQPGTDAPFRNHGLSVMRLLVTQLHIVSTRAGTVVHLRSTLPAPVPSS